MDLREWGAVWLSEISQATLVQDVKIDWIEGAATAKSETLQGQLVDEDGRALGSEAKTKSEYTHFMFETADMTAKAVPVRNGITLEWNSVKFKTVSRGGRCYTYNDVYQKKIVLITVLQGPT